MPRVPAREQIDERRKTCTDHCAGCGRHFHGLTAFEKHQQQGECRVDVLKKDGTPALQVWTADGYCDKDHTCWRDGVRAGWFHPVTIYQVAVSEDARERLLSLNSKKSDAQVALL